MVVGAADSVLLGMCELSFDPVCRETHFIEPGAACRTRGMRAVLTSPAQDVEHLAERGRHHRACTHIAMWKDMGVLVVDGMKSLLHFDCLLGEGDNQLACVNSYEVGKAMKQVDWDLA